MKRLLCILYCLCLWLNSFSQTYTVTCVDDFNPADDQISYSCPVESKSMRRSNLTGGMIELHYENPNSIPDTLKSAIRNACDKWEAVIPMQKKIILAIEMASLPNDVKITYDLHPYYGTCYPSSFYYNYIVNRDFDASSGVSDATIEFSDTVNWQCNYEPSTRTNTPNIITAMLRAIGIALGFGSSVKKTRRNVNIGGQYYTNFDKLIYNDAGEQLINSEPSTTSFNNFVQPTGDLWVRTQNDFYKLYAPRTFNDSSLKWLDNVNSLMHYDCKLNEKFLKIDSITINIMREIGWEIPIQEEIKIVCPDIPETGICSAYSTTYTFQLQGNNRPLSNLSWKYLLRNTNGQYSVISESNAATFTIPAVGSLQGYYVNCDGDMEGIIQATFTRNGVEETLSYKLTLECSPKIKGIYNEQVHNSNYQTMYDYSFAVEYSGASSITIGIEQEYSSYYEIRHIYEPYFAHAMVTELSRAGYVWIDVSVANQYGNDMHTIEIPPMYNLAHSAAVNTDVQAHQLHEAKDFAYIDIYDLNGKRLDRITDISSLNNYSGETIILKYLSDKNEIIKTKKVNIK